MYLCKWYYEYTVQFYVHQHANILSVNFALKIHLCTSASLWFTSDSSVFVMSTVVNCHRCGAGAIYEANLVASAVQVIQENAARTWSQFSHIICLVEWYSTCRYNYSQCSQYYVPKALE